MVSAIGATTPSAVVEAYTVCDHPAMLSKREQRLQELKEYYLNNPILIAKVSSSDESEKATQVVGSIIDIYA